MATAMNRVIASPADLELLQTALYALSVAELKSINHDLHGIVTGNKILLIASIMHFVQTGYLINVPIIPLSSRAPRKQPPTPISPNALMLYGAYKNDQKTRIFFKKLIGEHFHFTASGIDWLNERWLAGNPPTYQEYADNWTHEHEYKKTNPSAPKQEWAYICFTKNLLAENKSLSRAELLNRWHQHRTQQIAIVKRILAPLLKRNSR